MHTNNVEFILFGYRIQFSSIQVKNILSFFNISITGEKLTQNMSDWKFEDDWGGNKSINDEVEKIFRREL